VPQHPPCPGSCRSGAGSDRAGREGVSKPFQPRQGSAALQLLRLVARTGAELLFSRGVLKQKKSQIKLSNPIYLEYGKLKRLKLFSKERL